MASASHVDAIDRHLGSAAPPADEQVHKTGTDDGWHGVIKPGGLFPPEAGRYHLYIGLFCPFAHRANLVRHLKGLTEIISLSVVRPYPKGEPGWRFPQSDDEYPAATVDHLFGSQFLHQIYFRADPGYKGRYSVPVLWDKKLNTIVNNESAELLRWLPTAFDSVTPAPDAQLSGLVGVDFYPSHLAETIDGLTTWIQRDINSGVYKAGFATDQESYEKGVIPVFGALNKLEAYMAKGGGPYVLGPDFTELDIRVYATVVRFDVAYVQHFKCNLGTIRSHYPVINNWLRNLYWNVPGFKESTDFKHIKENYTKSQLHINPNMVTPMGPWPNVEGLTGVKETFEGMQPGAVDMPEVQSYAVGL